MIIISFKVFSISISINKILFFIERVRYLKVDVHVILDLYCLSVDISVVPILVKV